MIKRILILNIVSYLKVPGGAQESIENLICFLRDKQVKAIFISTNAGKFQHSTFNYQQQCLAERLEINIKNPFLFLISYFSAVIRIMRFRPQLVWAHHPIPYLLFKFILFRSRHLFTFHGPCIEELKRNNTGPAKIFLYRILTYVASLNATLHFNTDYVRTSVEDERAIAPSSQRKIVLPVLVYPPYYCKYCSRQHLSQINDYSGKKINLFEKKIILIPRRIEPRTGVFQLIKVINDNIAILGEESIFVFTGSGPDFTRSLALAKNNKSIAMTGFISHELLIDLINSSTSLIVPSIAAEGYCLPARIAYLFGKPLVSTGIGGLSVAYPLTLGHYLFNIDCPSSLVQALTMSAFFELSHSAIKERQTMALSEYSNDLFSVLDC